MLYRGQAYGDPVGEWWTTSRPEAEKFAMSRGGNRTYVVIAFDQELDEAWVVACLYVDRTDTPSGGAWYHIPIATLRKYWRGVRIVDGAIHLGDEVQP